MLQNYKKSVIWKNLEYNEISKIKTEMNTQS